MNRPLILVVDDNQDNTDILQQFLVTRGYEVIVAYNGEEALALFEERRPSLVLLDVLMPGMSGWEVCKAMKQHPVLGNLVRVIMVTGLDDWVHKREALQTGADDFVEKPLDFTRLLQTVERNAALLRAAM